MTSNNHQPERSDEVKDKVGASGSTESFRRAPDERVNDRM